MRLCETDHDHTSGEPHDDLRSDRPELERQAIELPSWAFGNSGTRFKVFAQPGVPRDPFEKIADAAAGAPCTPAWRRRSRCTSRGTGSTTSTSCARHAEDLGVRLGTINTNTFQDDDYKLGSLCHVDERVRAKAIAHALECVDIMDVTGSRDLKVWLPDGLNYPGQGDLRDRQDRLADSLAQVYARLGDAPAAGARVQVLRARLLRHRRARLGHGATCTASRSASGPSCASTPATTRPGTNIEFIVMQLLRLGRLGAFDFNSRFYADDDLIVGAADPFQLFRILFEVVRGGGYDEGSDVRFMLDQCHNIEAKIPGQIRSVLNVQEMTARALLVDRDALAEAERAGDVLGRQRRADGRLLHRRPRRPRRLAGGARPARRPDGGLRGAAGTPSASSPSASAATQAGWGA